ncbi:MAG: tetratricopeptide repeat protein, partial [Bacteroidaceae bacterium]|nr:tetratricopeptide repeat protein [Bacteroidaceae bacterium]
MTGRKRQRYFHIFCWVATMIVVLASCSTQKNTSTTRAWKAFTARYNTYFNGHQAYLNGYNTKLTGNKDNYTDYLPLLLVGNKNSQSLGKGDFETTVTKMEKTIHFHSIKKKPIMKRGRKMSKKDKEFRKRIEYNPFLKHAWMLMGYAQLQKGDFIEAASTFSYIETLYKSEPEVRNRARAMLALCYTELEWFYDAEDLLNKVRRDSIPSAARKEYNTAMADFHLKQKHWEEVLPYLIKEISQLKNSTEKARCYFLLGQIYKTLGRKTEAYKAFKKCMRK